MASVSTLKVAVDRPWGVFRSVDAWRNFIILRNRVWRCGLDSSVWEHGSLAGSFGRGNVYLCFIKDNCNPLSTWRNIPLGSVLLQSILKCLSCLRHLQGRKMWERTSTVICYYCYWHLTQRTTAERTICHSSVCLILYLLQKIVLKCLGSPNIVFSCAV